MPDDFAPFRTPQDEIDSTIRELIEEFGTDAVAQRIEGVITKEKAPELLTLLRWVLARIIDSQDPRMEADIMALGCGMLLRQGITVRELARRYSKTPAAISKRVIAFCDEFGLPPSYARKSEASRKNYSERNRGKNVGAL